MLAKPSAGIWGQSLLIILLMLLTFWIGKPAQGARPQQKTELAVFMLHGLNGSAETFCQLGEMLEAEFPAIQAKALVYSTGDSNKKPYDFVLEIVPQIKQFYQEENLDPATPFAIVAHSQGGIVSLKFIESCLMKNPRDFCGDVPNNMKLLLSLGTPYWGSPIAANPKIQGKTSKKSKSAREIRELAFGSLGLSLARKLLLAEGLDSKTGAWKNPLPEDLRIVAVAGDLTESEAEASGFLPLSTLIRFPGSLNKREFDMAVDVPSARPNFNYYIEKEALSDTIYQGKTDLPVDFHAVRLPHFENFSLSGIACFSQGKSHRAMTIVRSAMQSVLHKDPTLLAKIDKSAEADSYIKSLDNFSVQVALHVPLEYSRKPKFGTQDMSVEEVVGENGEAKIHETRSSNGLLFHYDGVNRQKTEYGAKKFVTFFHSGAVISPVNNQSRPDLEGKDFSFKPLEDLPPVDLEMKYRISIPGWKDEKGNDKTFTLKANPGWSTYAEVFLSPYLPIPPTGSTGHAGMRDGRVIVDDIQFGLTSIVGVYTEKKNTRVLRMVERQLAPESAQVAATAGASHVLVNSLMSAQEFQQLSAKSLNAPYLLENVMDKCWAAITGERVGVHKNQLFDSFYAEEAVDDLKESSSLLIVGRYSRGNMSGSTINVKERDRYLVRRGKQFRWINVIDVDILEPAPCS